MLAPPQEVDARDDGGQVIARNAEPASGLCAEAQEQHVVAFAQFLEADVDADVDAALQRDAHAEQSFDLGIEHVARQPVIGDRVAQHAARHLVLFVDRYAVAAARHLVGKRQARRSGTHDPDRVGPGFAVRFRQR